MSTVQVLCPNGRRQNVKTTPNTKLLQVLEEVCKKQGFLPPENFILIHGNNKKALDLTLSIRFANIPNNAKLELIKAESSRAEQDVLIALQLENGERLQHNFPPQTTLWDILIHWESLPDSTLKGHLTITDPTHVPPIHPTCIYMREEVIGEIALKDMTLKKLGLTGGKAVVRLVHRPVEETVLAEIIQRIEKEQNKQVHLDNIAQKKSLNEQTKTPQVQCNTEQDKDLSKQTDLPLRNSNSQSSNSENISDISKSEPMDVETSSSNIPMETDSSGALDSRKTENNGANVTDIAKDNSLEIVASSSRNVGNRSSEEVRRQQEAFADNIRQMNIPGVEVYTPGDFNDLSSEEQEMAPRLAAYYMPQLGIQSGQQQRVTGTDARPKRPKVNTSNTPNFSEFKFPEATKGKNVYKNELSEVNRDEFKPCERQAVLFSMLEEVHSPVTSEELPDNFFEVTENDVIRMYQDLQQKMKSSDDQPLMTKSMQQSKLEEKYSHYDRVIIRVQFPDKNVLQGLFRPKETVFAVQKFVKEYLEEKNMDFYLYTAPPKTVLKDRTQTLIEANLAPATVVYFGSSGEKEHHLSEAVLKEIGPRSKAEDIVQESLTKSKVSSSSSTEVASSSKPKPQKESKSSASGSQKQPGMPKWFTAGKKK